MKLPIVPHSIGLFIALVALAPATTFAAGYVPLVPDIPFVGTVAPGSFTNLLQALLAISVGIAALLAVIMLAIGGFKYMTTDSAFQLSGAKEQIRDAIVGLLIVLTAVLILRTINPKLISLDVFTGTAPAPAPTP